MRGASCNVCMRVCMHALMYTCIPRHVSIALCTHAFMHVLLHSSHMCVCHMHACRYDQTVSSVRVLAPWTCDACLRAEGGQCRVCTHGFHGYTHGIHGYTHGIHGYTHGTPRYPHATAIPIALTQRVYRGALWLASTHVLQHMCACLQDLCN